MDKSSGHLQRYEQQLCFPVTHCLSAPDSLRGMLSLAAFLTVSSAMQAPAIAQGNRGRLAIQLVIAAACTARVEPGSAGQSVAVRCDGDAEPPFAVGYVRAADSGQRIVTISF